MPNLILDQRWSTILHQQLHYCLVASSGGNVKSGVTKLRREKQHNKGIKPKLQHIHHDHGSRKTYGRFPFDEKFRFGFKEISRDKWKSNFRNFRRRGQPCEAHRNFQQLPFYDSLFWNSTVSGVSGSFPRKLPYHWSPFRKFSNFWFNGKRPYVHWWKTKHSRSLQLTLSWASISAPWPIRIVSRSLCPLAAARWREVRPSLSTWCSKAVALLIKVLATSTCPSRDAIWSAVRPYRSSVEEEH